MATANSVWAPPAMRLTTACGKPPPLRASPFSLLPVIPAPPLATAWRSPFPIPPSLDLASAAWLPHHTTPQSVALISIGERPPHLIGSPPIPPRAQARQDISLKSLGTTPAPTPSCCRFF